MRCRRPTQWLSSSSWWRKDNRSLRRLPRMRRRASSCWESFTATRNILRACWKIKVPCHLDSGLAVFVPPVILGPPHWASPIFTLEQIWHRGRREVGSHWRMSSRTASETSTRAPSSGARRNPLARPRERPRTGWRKMTSLLRTPPPNRTSVCWRAWRKLTRVRKASAPTCCSVFFYLWKKKITQLDINTSAQICPLVTRRFASRKPTKSWKWSWGVPRGTCQTRRSFWGNCTAVLEMPI